LGWILCLTRRSRKGFWVVGEWVLKSLPLISQGIAWLGLFVFEDWE
jgi:hypothetical protein